MLVFVVLLYAFIVVFELLPMIKKSRRKDFWIYLIGLAASFVVAVLIGLDVRLPSSSKAIKNIVLMLTGD